MDYTPKPHMMLSIQNQGLTWWKVLAELIDNSLDAGANQVKLSFKNKKLTVVDDGKGIKNIASAVTLGYHDPHSSNGIGTYGIGLKDAWLFCGTIMKIDTVRNGKRTILIADTNELHKNNWKGSDPKVCDTDKKNGTKIELSVTRQQPKAQVIDRLRWLYTPALSQGRQILYSKGCGRSIPLEPLSIPLFKDVVSDTFEVHGRIVTINIGIIPEGKKMHYGPFWVTYGMRVIAKTALGAGKFSAMHIGGTIELGKEWVLNKNKDDFSEHKDELGDAIYERIVHVLEKAEKLSEDVESDALKSDVEDMLNVSVANAKKEARKKGNGSNVGGIPPGHTGRRRKRAKRTTNEDGNVLENGKKKGKFTIAWAELDDENQIGEYDKPGDRVNLNIKHAFIMSAKGDGNTVALYSIAVALMSEYFTTHKDGEKLLFGIEDFSLTYGTIIKGIKEVKKDEEATR